MSRLLLWQVLLIKNDVVVQHVGVEYGYIEVVFH